MSKTLVLIPGGISPALNSKEKEYLKLSLQSIRCCCFKYLKHRPLVGRGSSILVLLTVYYLPVLVIAL